MEIRNPLQPLRQSGDLRPGSRRAPAEGFAELVQGREDPNPSVVFRDELFTSPPSAADDYGELLRQARLQRVAATTARDLSASPGPTHSDRAVAAYHETLRLAARDAGPGELVGIDQYV